MGKQAGAILLKSHYPYLINAYTGQMELFQVRVELGYGATSDCPLLRSKPLDCLHLSHVSTSFHYL